MCKSTFETPCIHTSSHIFPTSSFRSTSARIFRYQLLSVLAMTCLAIYKSSTHTLININEESRSHLFFLFLQQNLHQESNLHLNQTTIPCAFLFCFPFQKIKILVILLAHLYIISSRDSRQSPIMKPSTCSFVWVDTLFKQN